MMRFFNIILILAFISCKQKEHKKTDYIEKYITEIKATIQNDSIKGVHYKLLVVSKIEGVLDSGSWYKLNFIFDDKILINKIYDFKNANEIKADAKIGGAWIGIVELKKIKGKFLVKKLSENELIIQLQTPITGEMTEKESSEIKIKTISEIQTVVFKKK